MKRFKKAATLVLAVALVLSFAEPFISEVSVRASGENDLTGWTLGGTTTALTGNPGDGWRIAFHGASYETNGTFYMADMDVSKIQVKFRLSELAVGKSIILQFASQRGPFDKGDSTRVNFCLSRVDEKTLNFHGFDTVRFPGEQGGVFNYHSLGGFDFEADHTFAFAQENGKWVPTIDGAPQTGDEDTNAVYDAFVKNMLMQSAGRTTVAFVPNDGLDAVDEIIIQNIRFEKDASDLTGWRLGDTTALNGNREEGWRIDFGGEQYINNGTSYEANIDVSKLQVVFNLSELAIGKTIILQFADSKCDFGSNTDTVVNFVFERRTEETLFFYDLGQMANTHLMESFDFTGDHVFEFVQEKGKWMPALDGMVLSDGEKAEVNASYDTFVKTMSAQFLEKTTVSFAPVSADDTVLTIRNISFIEKAKDLTGWMPGATSALYGSSVEGWKIDFYGARYEGNGSSYTADIDISRLQVNFNLTGLTQGKEIILQFGDARGDFGTGAPARVNFLFSKADDNTLIFHGLDEDKFSGTAGVFNYHRMDGFDVGVDHTFTFVQENGKWLPALDGMIQKGDAETNAVYDDFVKTMSLRSAGETVVSFAPNDNLEATEIVTITNINFVRSEMEPEDMDWLGPLATGDSKPGYEIVNGQYEWSYFTKKLDTAEVTMQAKISLDVDTWIALELSDGTERTLLPTREELLDQKRMMFLLGRQRNGADLRVSLWNGEGELLLGVICNFDFDVAHTFALRQIDNAYYMVIDGAAYGSAYQDEMKKYAENIRSGSEGKVYYRFFGSEIYGVQEVRFLVRGDLDGDYDRTESDVSILRKRLVGAEIDCNCLDDINEDKQSDVADLVRLMKLTGTSSVWSGGASVEDGLVVVNICDYGATGDGRTNDMPALQKALDMARSLSKRNKVVLKFEPDTEYYFKTRNGETAVFELTKARNITLHGENTTIIMDKSPDPAVGAARLITYVNVDSSENIAIEGFNFKFSQSWYTMATVTEFHKGQAVADSGKVHYVNTIDPPYIEITIDHSLGIIGTYTPTNRTAFGLPYTSGDSRNHMYIDRIETIDPGAKRYRVYFQDWDDIREKMDFMQRNDLQFILGIPYWDRGEASDGTGAVIVTGTTNLDMKHRHLCSI